MKMGLVCHHSPPDVRVFLPPLKLRGLLVKQIKCFVVYHRLSTREFSFLLLLCLVITVQVGSVITLLKSQRGFAYKNVSG